MQREVHRDLLQLAHRPQHVDVQIPGPGLGVPGMFGPAGAPEQLHGTGFQEGPFRQAAVGLHLAVGERRSRVARLIPDRVRARPVGNRQVRRGAARQGQGLRQGEPHLVAADPHRVG